MLLNSPWSSQYIVAQQMFFTYQAWAVSTFYVLASARLNYELLEAPLNNNCESEVVQHKCQDKQSNQIRKFTQYSNWVLQGVAAANLKIWKEYHPAVLSLCSE